MSNKGVSDLVARIPGTIVVTVANATHMIAGDRNDAFADAIASFVRERVSVGIHRLSSSLFGRFRFPRCASATSLRAPGGLT